jgi:hypothetical protein
VEDDRVADLLALGHVGAAGQDHKRLRTLGVLRLGRCCERKYEEVSRPTMDRRTPIASNIRARSLWTEDRPPL